ncbi:MAG: TIM barrel protein [Planctomycetes bacterium]|nr:TIM barrel protein [Planctomycetota bacterium]MCB9871028.1 TIM barrel protein [Planctomycetota bacterium]
MQRRTFLAATAGALGTGFGLTGQDRQDKQPAAATNTTSREKPFRLKYAPHLGMFKNHAKDPVDQIQFMADQGFRAMEDNGMARRPVPQQEKIAAALAKNNMTMGVFVATADFRKPTFASKDPKTVDKILQDMRNAVQVAKRVNAKWCTVVPGGFRQNIEWDYQTATAIDNLRRAAEICEAGGLIMVLEPLNPWRDHAGCFLSKVPQAYLWCRAVNSPSCKILDDLYHQQITEGNLIPNIDLAWSEIAYFQLGDNPGRKEPGTGEVNFKNVFKHIHAKGYDGVIGMEHGNSKPGKEGEMAVIRAYQECDMF